MTEIQDTRPKTICIGPIRYRIEYVYDLHNEAGEKVDGRHHSHSALIEIEARLDPQEQRISLLHETLHAIVRQAGYINGEVPDQILESLSYGIQNILNSNAFLRELL